MFTSWLFFALLAGLFSNLYNFLNRLILTREEDSSAFGWFTEIFRFAIALIIVRYDNFFSLGSSALIIFLLLGVVEVVSIFIFMKMHAYSHLSVSTIISRTRLIWIPIIAFFILGEKLKVTEYLGIIILFFGLSIAVSPKKLFLDKGVTYAYLSAIVVAILSIVMKMASPLMSTSFVLIGMSFLVTFTFPFILKSGISRVIITFRKQIILKIFAASSNVLAMYLYVYALKIGDVSKVTAIYQGMMVVSILAGIVLLKEKEDAAKKIVGAAITLGGVLLLTVF